MRTTRYHTALAEGRKPIGMFCCLDGYATTHIFAAAGFDFMIFDRQHATYSWTDLEQLCLRVRSTGAAVFIRTASTEEAELNLALDLPIDGLVLPNLVSAADTERALRFTKFPPRGIRSIGNERYDAIWNAYHDPDPMIGMLVEHPGAVAEIDQIFALGIEFAWIGVHDLSALMGLDPHTATVPGNVAPELAAAMSHVREAARRAKVPFWGRPKSDADAIMGAIDARLVRQIGVQTLESLRAS